MNRLQHFVLSLMLPICLLGYIRSAAQIDSLKTVLITSVGTERVDVLNKLAYEMAFRQTDSSYLYAHQALAFAQSLSYEKGVASSHRNIGFASHLRGQLDTALYHYDAGLNIELAGTDSVAIYSLLNNRGSIFQMMGNIPKALESYQQSLDIKRALNKTASAATTLNNIGIIHYQQKDYAEALDYYYQALDLDTEITNYRGMARALGNIGLTFLELEEFDSALIYYSQAYGVSDSLDIPCQKQYSANGLAEAYFEKGDMALAKKFSAEALEEGRNCEDPVMIASALLTLGQIAIDDRDRYLGETLLLESYEIASTNGLQHQIRDISLVLYQFYKAQSQMGSALKYFEQHTLAKDSLFNENLTKELTSMAMTYAFDQEKDSIQFQQQKTAITHQAELSRRSFTLWLAVAILVLVVVVLVVLYQFYLQKKKANVELAEKNQVISSSLDEREILLREVHHRVKNNFQLVSGVLMIQANASADEAAKSALLDVRNRIQSMAMTHQRLYQSDSIASVDLSSFMTDLIDELALSHENFDLKTDIAEIEVSIDLAITLGLILTEGMLNVFKHAITDNDNPTLKIVLRQSGDEITLEMMDNGAGFSPEENPSSFGLKMIKSMAQKASGSVNWRQENGTVMHVVLKLS